MEKIFENKEFHGEVSFFKGLTIRLGALITKALTVEGNFRVDGFIGQYLDPLVMFHSVRAAGSNEFYIGGFGAYTQSGMTFADEVSGAGAHSWQWSLRGASDTDNSFMLSNYDASDTTSIMRFLEGGAVSIEAGVLTVKKGILSTAQDVTPDNSETALNQILSGVNAVDVQAVTNDTDDFIILPPLANVPVGHTIKIACNAGTAFELRTLAFSTEKINTVNCEGTQEYLCTDTEVITITKVSDADGWVATAQTALGAIAPPVVPHVP